MNTRNPLDLANGTERVLAATVGLSASTALWEAGELSAGQYVDAVMLGNGINSGTVPVMEGLVGLMRLWMIGPDPLGADGF